MLIESIMLILMIKMLMLIKSIMLILVITEHVIKSQVFVNCFQ